tara:strand:- start:60 stop:206 length:147 start_codon:yes stop_codon:yes gene_type:complete
MAEEKDSGFGSIYKTSAFSFSPIPKEVEPIVESSKTTKIINSIKNIFK